MGKRWTRIVIAGALLLGLLVSFRPAEARLWQYGDDRLWSLMRACQDGGVIFAGTWYYGQEETLRFTPRLFPSTSSKPVPVSVRVPTWCTVTELTDAMAARTRSACPGRQVIINS